MPQRLIKKNKPKSRIGGENYYELAKNSANAATKKYIHNVAIPFFVRETGINGDNAKKQIKHALIVFDNRLPLISQNPLILPPKFGDTDDTKNYKSRLTEQNNIIYMLENYFNELSNRFGHGSGYKYWISDNFTQKNIGQNDYRSDICQFISDTMQLFNMKKTENNEEYKPIYGEIDETNFLTYDFFNFDKKNTTREVYKNIIKEDNFLTNDEYNKFIEWKDSKDEITWDEWLITKINEINTERKNNGTPPIYLYIYRIKQKTNFFNKINEGFYYPQPDYNQNTSGGKKRIKKTKKKATRTSKQTRKKIQ